MDYHKSNWPYKWFGFWKEYGVEYINFPSVISFLDNSINQNYKKEKLLSYLRNGKVVAITSHSSFPNPINGQLRYGTIAMQTDGKWVWLENICDLIENNILIIPDDFLQWIEHNNYIMPNVSDIDISKLEWPSILDTKDLR